MAAAHLRLRWAGPCGSRRVLGWDAGGSTEAGLKIPSYPLRRRSQTLGSPHAASVPYPPRPLLRGPSALREVTPRRYQRCQGLRPWESPCPGLQPPALLVPPAKTSTHPPAPSSQGSHGQLACLHLCPLEAPSPLPTALWARWAAGLAAALWAAQESRGPDDALGVSPAEPLVRPHAFPISGCAGSSVAEHTHPAQPWPGPTVASQPGCSRLSGLSPRPAVLPHPSCPRSLAWLRVHLRASQVIITGVCRQQHPSCSPLPGCLRPP